MDHIALSVADLDAWIAKLRAEKVTFLEPPLFRTVGLRCGDDRRPQQRGDRADRSEMSVRRRVVPTFLAWLAAVLLIAAPAKAQLQLAAIRGVVLDPSDLVIPGVTIDLTDPLGSIISSTNSDDSGRFAISNVAPGAMRCAPPSPALLR